MHQLNIYGCVFSLPVWQGKPEKPFENCPLAHKLPGFKVRGVATRGKPESKQATLRENPGLWQALDVILIFAHRNNCFSMNWTRMLLSSSGYEKSLPLLPNLIWPPRKESTARGSRINRFPSTRRAAGRKAAACTLLCSNKEDWNDRSPNHHFLPPATVRKHHNLAMIRTSWPASTSLLSPVPQAWSLWRWSKRQRLEFSSHRFGLVFRNKVINGVGRGGWLLRTHYP